MKHTTMIGIGMMMTGLAIVGLTLALSRPANAPKPSPTPAGQVKTFRGDIICLPHKDRSGPQTMECAMGLAGDDDKLYGIKPAHAVSNPPYDVSQKVVVTGILVAPLAGETYDVTGNITAATVVQQ